MSEQIVGARWKNACGLCNGGAEVAAAGSGICGLWWWRRDAVIFKSGRIRNVADVARRLVCGVGYKIQKHC